MRTNLVNFSFFSSKIFTLKAKAFIKKIFKKVAGILSVTSLEEWGQRNVTEVLQGGGGVEKVIFCMTSFMGLSKNVLQKLNSIKNHEICRKFKIKWFLCSNSLGPRGLPPKTKI